MSATLRVLGISKHETVKDMSGKYTLFTIEVAQISPDGKLMQSWWVDRRFSEFCGLSDHLSQERFSLPPLPPKKMFGGFDEAFLQRRRHELQFWLDQVMKHSRNFSGQNIQHSRAMYQFLTEGKKMKSDLGDDMEGVEEHSTTETLVHPEAGKKVSLEDFELLKVIGKGSYGKVTLVRKKDSGLMYAMKVLSKDNVKKRRQVEHTKTERDVLGKTTKHPFIVHLHYAFQTRNKLYFVLDFCPGGELFFHLSRMERMSEPMACFYSAELVLALEYLHSVGVVYRDLKPENILFDMQGHVLLADFGLSKANVYEGTEGSNSMCGTPEYLPPEMLDRVGHGTAVDWWALGMVVYEMITGLPPWYTRNRQKLFHSIRFAEVEFPLYMSKEAKDLIAGLLQKSPKNRLGTRSAEDVKRHPFYANIDWKALYERRIPAPFNPCAGGAMGDTTNFEAEFTTMPISSVADSAKLGSSSSYRKSGTFSGFTYQTPSAISSLGSNR